MQDMDILGCHVRNDIPYHAEKCQFEQ